MSEYEENEEALLKVKVAMYNSEMGLLELTDKNGEPFTFPCRAVDLVKCQDTDTVARIRDESLSLHEYRNSLYDLLARDHNITALESELDNIAHVVLKSLIDRIQAESEVGE